MRARFALFVLAPWVAACGANQGDPLGTAEEALTVCAAGSTLEGIDVSTYDGTIDWAQVKASGRAFAFAKATEGVTITDSTFATNWAAMKQAGVVRGAYCFFHSTDDPVAEANYFLGVMGKLEPGDLPPTLDLEVTDSQSAATITANAITWLDTVAAATGTRPILYTSPSFVTGSLGSPAGLESHAQLWIANWGVSCPDVPSPFTDWPFWQYNDTATVPGVPGSSGACDVNKFNGDLAALQALAAQSSSSSSGAGASSSSSSSGAPLPTCQVDGIDGDCIDTSVCAGMPGYISTPGYCPGPASEECCTPTGSSTSSSSGGASSSSSTSGTSGATTSSSGAGGSGAPGSSGAGGATGSSSSSSGAGAASTWGTGNTSSSCSAAATGTDAGAAARACLGLALAALAARRKGARDGGLAGRRRGSSRS